MSTIVCYIIIGKVKGFYDPGLEMVLFYGSVFFIISVFFGLPLLIALFSIYDNKVKKSSTSIFLFITILTLSISVMHYFLPLKSSEFVALLISYVSGYFYLLYYALKKRKNQNEKIF
jgi:Ca2+/Na+ antiporter